MTRLCRKILGLFLAAVFLASSINLNVCAQGTTVLPKVIHKYISGDDLSVDEWTNALRGAYLGRGSCVITRADSTHVHIGGDTDATRVCDEVELRLYLERSKSYATGYTTYKHYTFTEYNDYAVSKEISNIPVERGYYYRVVGVHYATHNGVTEGTNSVTNPIDYR